MDVFNKLLAQLNDLFKTMSPGARLTAGLLLVAVVVSLGYLFNTQSSGADAYLLNGQSFTADEMSVMEGAFGKAGLSDYTVDGSRIRISKSRQAAFLGALADQGAMPSRFGDHLTKAVGDMGPFTSRQHSEELIKVAKQKELAAVIRSMQGIENATVMFDTQKKSGIKQETSVTASVSVKPRGLMALDAKQVPMIRSLVAGAIAGLNPENVTVVDVNGRSYSRSTGTGGGASGQAFDDPYIQRQREYQSIYEDQIASRLSHIPGVLVTANVELDRTMRSKSIESKIDPKTTFPIQSHTTEKTLLSESGGGPKGPPGLASQQPGANTGASLGGGGGGSSKTEDSTTETQTTNTGNHGTTESELAGLTPKRVAVSVGVPTTYFEKVWMQRNPAPAGQEVKKPDATALTTIADEELKNIRAAIAAIIPDPITLTGTPVDKMSLIDVAAYSPVAPADPAGPSFVDRAMDWLAQSWSTVAMIGLGLFSLMMLKSFVKSIPAPAPASSILSHRTDGDESEGEDGAAAPGEAAKPKQRTLQRKLGTGASLREELIEMVKEDPDAAANVLRGWIGNVT